MIDIPKFKTSFLFFAVIIQGYKVVKTFLVINSSIDSYCIAGGDKYRK